MTSLNTSSFESRGEYLAHAAGHAACVAALTVAHPTRYLRCSSRTPTPARASPADIGVQLRLAPLGHHAHPNAYRGDG